MLSVCEIRVEMIENFMWETRLYWAALPVQRDLCARLVPNVRRDRYEEAESVR